MTTIRDLERSGKILSFLFVLAGIIAVVAIFYESQVWQAYLIATIICFICAAMLYPFELKTK